jgi:hypothetical protein
MIWRPQGFLLIRSPQWSVRPRLELRTEPDGLTGT